MERYGYRSKAVTAMTGMPSPSRMFEDLERLGLAVTGDSAEGFLRFYDFLVERARVDNLIGPSEQPRLWTRHFLESAAYGLLLPRGAEVVDIGTGAGFPGMILAIMGYSVRMVEPRRKRYLFLSVAAERLELDRDRAQVVCGRVEECGPFPGGTWFTARSVSPSEKILANLGGLAGRGSMLIQREPEVDPGKSAVRSLELPVPPLDRGGLLVQYRVCSESEGQSVTGSEDGEGPAARLKEGGK